jgi:hypothetical protein
MELEPTMNVVAKNLVASATVLGTLLCTLSADADPTTHTLSWTVTVLANKKGAVLVMSPPACPAGQVFLVTGVQATLDPSAFAGSFPTGNGMIGTTPWAVQVAINQPLANGAKPTMLTAFGLGMSAASATLFAGQPYKGTVSVLMGSTMSQPTSFNIHLGGTCGAPPSPLPNPAIAMPE